MPSVLIIGTTVKQNLPFLR